jgi:hypothetical protein
MEHHVEKLLYSRRDAATALSLSIRSIDYLITTGKLLIRRVGGKTMVTAGSVRRFAREDHPETVRTNGSRCPRKPPTSTTSTRLEEATKALDSGELSA